MKSTFRACLFGLALMAPVFASSPGLLAQEPDSREITPAAPTEPTWFFEQSDVEVDPGFVFGQLDNGMRYILRQNATPEGTALVRMRIDSGSLDENENELGLSHFLEHMAFNGSTNIPEGEMIKLLEREGLAFGADTNASTGLEAITYMLNLPRNDDGLLDTALMLMRETASELTIAEDAVDRERGVILAERRDRRGFAQRAREDSFEFTAPGARFTKRLPIGTLEVLERATAADIRALYERTYTPSNTVLVIVGDYPTQVMETKIREWFADWEAAAAPVEPEAGPIDITRSGETDIYLDPALSESVTITSLGPWVDEPDTLANRDKSALRRIGYGIIARRLARLARGQDAPFRGARFGTSDIFEDARSTTISISSADGEWRKGILAAVREVHQAMTYGFTQAELDEQLANVSAALENAVQAADTRTNGAFAGGALRLVSNDAIPTEPSYRLEQWERLLPSITPAMVYQAVREHALPLEAPLIRFQGRTGPDGDADALRAAFAEAMALPIAPPEDSGTADFAYTDFGEPGEIVSDTTDSRLGFRYITFANGVRLTLKSTDIREDRVSFRMEVDGGTLLATRDDPLKVAMVSAIANGGLGAHSQDELNTVLAGRTVGFGLGTNTDRFQMATVTTPRDMELQLQLAAALLTDPGYRREGEERYRRSIDSFFANLDATPGRALGNAIGGILSDNDPRFTLQSKDAFLALDYAKLDAAIGDRLTNGAIEVALVGDLDEEAAIDAVSRTLGALSAREVDFLPREDARIRSFTADRSARQLTHSGEADQALLRFDWPTDDDSDLERTLKLSLLARVTRLELTDRLREDLGQAYSPSAGSSASRNYPGYGTFRISASVDVAEVEATRAAIIGMIEDLRGGQIDEDTLERARKPLLETYDNALKNLSGWMSLAARAQSRPERLERWFAAPDLIAAITPNDLVTTAETYLAPDQAVETLVLPGENAKPASDEGTADDVAAN